MTTYTYLENMLLIISTNIHVFKSRKKTFQLPVKHSQTSRSSTRSLGNQHRRISRTLWRSLEKKQQTQGIISWWYFPVDMMFSQLQGDVHENSCKKLHVYILYKYVILMFANLDICKYINVEFLKLRRIPQIWPKAPTHSKMKIWPKGPINKFCWNGGICDAQDCTKKKEGSFSWWFQPPWKILVKLEIFSK